MRIKTFLRVKRKVERLTLNYFKFDPREIFKKYDKNYV